MRTALKNKMMKMSMIILTAAMLLIGGASAPADDWPISETGWKAEWGADGPKKLWTKSIGVGFSSIVVADGRAYMTGNTGRKKSRATDKDVVYCVDAATGQEIWTHGFTCKLLPKWYEGGTLASPTVDGKVVYTISKAGDLFCLDAATGKVIWNKNVNKEYGFKLPTWHFSGSPLVMGDMLYFNLGTAGAAIDKKTGRLVWDNGKDVCGYSTPVPCRIDGQECLAIAASKTVVGVRPSDGKVLWEHPLANKHKVNAADLIVSGNSVFMSSGYNRGCARITIAGGKVTLDWDNREMRNHMNCSMLYKGYIYGFDEQNLKCIDFKDGSEKWSDGSFGKGALMMSTDGRMIIMSDKGELGVARAEPGGFKQIARAPILPKGKCWTVPVLADSKIYARNAAGDAVCVDVSGK